MLGDENRMAAKGRLFAVIRDDRRRQAFGDEISGVVEDHCQAFVVQIFAIFAAQMKAAAEGRLGERGKEVIQVSHEILISHAKICVLEAAASQANDTTVCAAAK